MRAINKTITAPGTYVFALDWWVNPFNVAWNVIVGSGATASFTLNETLDPILVEQGTGYGVPVQPNPTWAPTTGTWPATATVSGDQTSPIRAFQLVVTALTGGDLTVNIIQPISIN